MRPFILCVLSSILVVTLCQCIAANSPGIHVHVNMESDTSPNVGTNLFKKTPRQSCSCTSCTCNGDTCPQSVPASGHLYFTPTCLSTQTISGYSINAQSTDGSTFKLYYMDNSEYEKFKAGGSFSYYPTPSVTTASTCVNSGPYSFSSNTITVVVKCSNLLYNCPIKFSTSGSCLTTPTIASLSLTAPSTIGSEATFTTIVKAIDSNGNTINTGGTVNLYWDGGVGTLYGNTITQFSNGATSFDNFISTSNTITGTLRASFVSGGTTYTKTKSITVYGTTPQTSSKTQSGYASSWAGKYVMAGECLSSSCCCLTGTMSITKTNTNSVYIQVPVNGNCNGLTSYTATVENINSELSLQASFSGGDSYLLTRIGSQMSATNQNQVTCSTIGQRNDSSSISLVSSFMILLIVFLFF